MRTYRKLLIPALVVGALFVPSTVAEAKVDVSVEGGQTSHYDTLSAAVAELGATKATITFTENETGDNAKDVTIPAGADYTIDGAGKAFGGTIKAEATGGQATHLSINDLAMDGGGSKGMAIISQNQDTKPNDLYLTVTNSSISDYTSKGMYLTNAKELTINNVTFTNNATVEQDKVKGDYTVDLNLIGVQDAKVSISNSTFVGEVGGNAPIKVTQRGYADDVMTDISYYYVDGKPTGNPAASIASLTIANCDFSAVTGNSKGDVALGSSPNADGSARLSNSNFPVEVTAGETPIDIYVRGTADEEAAGTNTHFTVDAGKTGAVVTDSSAELTSDQAEFALEVGATYKPAVYLQTSTGKVNIADVLNVEKLSFASDNDKVATVSEDGTVAATGEGVAKITATYGDQTYTWTVTVKNDMAVTDPETGGDEADTTEPVENVENPQTYDGSMMFIIAGVISALGLAGAGVGLGKESK